MYGFMEVNNEVKENGSPYPLHDFKKSQVEQNCVLPLFFAFERRKVFAQMRGAVEIEETAEQEVVVDEAVPNPFTSDYAFKRYLKSGKLRFQKVHEFVGNVGASATDTAEHEPYRQKLFLHKSVSRFKPRHDLLKGWCERLYASPVLRIAKTGCVVSLIQPNTKRPGRTFHNPYKPKGKYAYNDGLSYSAIVLLRHGHFPQREHDEASHRCGHGRCVNVAHLVWESLAANSVRNECHHYHRPCHCNPRCIPYDPAEGLRVKAAIANERKIRKKHSQHKLK
jgi:hypothetical protein